MNKNVKKIFKISAIAMLGITFIMCIVCLVNYYNYVGVIRKLTSGELDLLSRFDLQEARDSYLYSTLTSLVWTVYITIITVALNIANIFINKTPKKIEKIR